MSRKDDLEQAISESNDLIREYQAILRESESPRQMAGARRNIAELRGLIEGYQAELEGLTVDAQPNTATERGTLPPQAEGKAGGRILTSDSRSRQESKDCYGNI